jgi:hypothetical protein
LAVGYWLWDYKLVGSEPNLEAYMHNEQPFLYQHAWNAIHPKQQLVGAVTLLVTKPTKAKPTRIIPTVHETPTPYHFGVLARFFAQLQGPREHVLAALEHDWFASRINTRPTQCFYPSVCPYFTNGACDRT